MNETRTPSALKRGSLPFRSPRGTLETARWGPTRARFAATLLALSSVPGIAHAQGNDRSAPTGGRSILMGNTGVALAEDGAAPFLNPATIIRIHDRSLAFSVNLFTFGYTHFSGWHQPGPVDTSQFGDLSLSHTAVSTYGFNALPSTLCLFFTVAGVSVEGGLDGLRKGRQKLAVCLGSVEASNIGLGALSFNGNAPGGTTAQVQTFSSRWHRIYVGPSYSLSLSNKLALGLSLHGVATQDTFDIEGSAITSTPGGGSIESSLGTTGSGHAFDVTALLGAIYQTGPVTLGASFQVPSIHVVGSYSGAFHNEYAGNGTVNAALTSGSGRFGAPPPVRASLGVGASFGKLTFEVDGSYDLPISNVLETSISGRATTTAGGVVSSAPVSATYAVPMRSIVNVAAGAEYMLSPTFSVIGGASTNLSSLPPLNPSMTLGNLIPARTNSANVSFGVGAHGDGDNLLLGLQLGYGWGESLAANPYVVPNSWAIVSTQTCSAMIVVAGATNLRAIGRAAEKVGTFLRTGKPEPPPAPAPPVSPPAQ